MNYNDELLKFPSIIDGRETLPRNANKQWDKRDPSKLLGLVCHQSLDNYGTAAGNAKYHSGPNHISKDGLPGLSYTLFCEHEGGQLYLANDVEDKTYSQGDRKIEGDENALYLAVCFGGNFSAPGYEGTMQPSPGQRDMVKLLWEHCKKIWGWKNNQLFGHYDFGKATCPGHVIGGIIEAINRDKDWDEPKFDLSTIEGRQKALAELGYYTGKIDGEWGPVSRGSLTEFQKSVGLIPDGVWGKKTRAAIVTALG